MNKLTTISAIVIAKNEEERLGTCLESLSWVDERIVVDNDSQDKTLEIAKKYNAKIINAKNVVDFSVLRTIGMKAALGKWILYIDADEEVPESLKNEIKKLLVSFDVSRDHHGYYLRRNNFYLGHAWPVQDRMQRLFLLSSLKGWHGQLHETAVVEGSFGQLSSPLVHRTHRTLKEMVEKTNSWSEIEARLRFDAHHPEVSWWRLVRVMCTAFIDSFFKQGGWRAGTVGWIESTYQAFSIFTTYAKLWEMQKIK